MSQPNQLPDGSLIGLIEPEFGNLGSYPWECWWTGVGSTTFD
jgi:hypothetical protein